MKRLFTLTFVCLLLAGQAWGETYSPTSHAEMMTAISSIGMGDTITITGSWTATDAYTITDNNAIINSSSSSNTILRTAKETL